jgi:hypothetical protein
VLSRSKPTFPKAPDLTHDRQKQRPIPPDREYLKLLGISTAEGKIKDKQYAKFRQVNRFVLILEDLLKQSELPKDRPLRVADMGSGKGYLTFALYDHFRNTLGINAVVTGVEERPHLAEMCDAAARTCGFEGLTFTSGRIGSSNVESPDILIALHACDTATDDALYFGISGRAKIIVAAPCCHKELRHELRFPETLAPLNSYGLLLERETESITDGVRAVLLEHCGYSVRMFEFVSPEHTPKNNLIADTFRISSQRLEYLLAHQDPLSDPESGSQMV